MNRPGPRPHLTREQAQEVLDGLEPVFALAARFGVTTEVVRNVRLRRSWRLLVVTPGSPAGPRRPLRRRGWTNEEDAYLRGSTPHGTSIKAQARHLGRTPGATRLRRHKLGLRGGVAGASSELSDYVRLRLDPAEGVLVRRLAAERKVSLAWVVRAAVRSYLETTRSTS